MIDMSQISSALTSLNVIKTLLSAAIGSRDDAKILAANTELLFKLAEAIGEVNALHIAASHGNTQLDTALRTNRNLEEKIEGLERQQHDFERYDLHELSVGVLVYRLRQLEQPLEPSHYLCSHCRNDGKKSILARHETGVAISHVCPHCKMEYLEVKKPSPKIGRSALAGSHVGWMDR